MSRFLNPRLAHLEVYTPGEQPQDQVYTKLNTNESPYPAAPEVVAAIDAEQVRNLRLYSDPVCRPLIEKLAQVYGLHPNQVFVSNGSDDILNFAFWAFAGQPGKAAYPDVTYGFYQVFADLHQVEANVIPLQADFSVRVEDYLNLGQMIVLANPNAQVGRALTRAEMERIIAANPDHVVVVDEAYVDFGAESCVPLIDRYPNLLVVQTFSKSRSLAGARLGFALGSAELIADLNRLKYSTNPYNVNRLTMAAGVAALEAADYYAKNCRAIQETRAWTVQALEALGFTVVPSLANFVLAAHKTVDGETIYRELKRRGILVRHFTAPRIANYNRITIGSPEQMALLVQTLGEIL
ncbi:MAG TPA: histidinol-phosphate transaminase [Candidatus Avoscillospira stercorigallinarum]|uniref:Histidinol-phosphate aminotransferase n=1 Tax=Candidatus Avoscillospira stercorigallinarum TaxID=2840708 RepID=A0A9D0Z935_9FIRM|nr:histidinol-phosphate transaminase [Candidatus Avoscillospira stercorigallinarum]